MRKVIYTVIVNGYDALLEQPAYPGWDYVCYTDGKRLPLRARLGLSRWQIREMPDWGYDQFRASRIPKILPHLFLKDYDYSVYIDGNAILVDNPDHILEKHDWPFFANAHHPFRTRLDEEFDACIETGKSDPILLNMQADCYWRDGAPGDCALMENNLLMRAHNHPDTKALDMAWWQEMNRVSHRDQLSLPYLSWRDGIQPIMISQEEKRTMFRTKGHYRSPLQRLKRSIEKRLPQS